MPPDASDPAPDAHARGNMVPIVVGQGVSLFGDYLAIFTLVLYVIDLTGRERDLGLTAAAETLPMLLFGFAAGVLLDRVALKRALIFSDVVRSVAFLLLAVAIGLDAAEMWVVLVVAFLAGTMTVIFESGLQAFLPLAFIEDVLVVANSRLFLAVSVATVLGPATGGLLVAVGGFEVAFVINAATFLISAAFLGLVRVLRPRGGGEATGGFWSSLAEGLRFLWREPRLRWATMAGAVANLAFAPIAATLALFAKDELSLGDAGVGLYFAVYAAMGAVGALVAPRVAKRLKLGRTMVAGMLLLGGGFLVVSFSTGWVQAVVATGVAFVGVGWINIALNTLRQRITPDELLGRVMAASRTIAWLGIPLGAAVGGMIADSTGILPVYRAASAAVLATALVLVLTPLWRRPEPTDDRSNGVPAVSEATNQESTDR